MSLAFNHPDALPLLELVNGEPSATVPPGTLPGSPQDQNSAMQELGQTVTNLALTQVWSFAGAAADTAFPESASLGTVSAKAQGLVPEFPLSGTLASERSNTEAGSGDLAPTGLLTPVTSEGGPVVDNLQTPRSRQLRPRTQRLSSQPTKRSQTMKTT